MAVEAPNTLLSTSNLRILDLLCEGPIKGFVVKNPNPIFSGDPLMATYYDDIPVRNIDGSYNYNVSGQGFAFGYTLGTVDQAPITGFEKIENVIPLSSNTRIANPAVGAGPYKTVIASFNTDTYPDANSINVTVRIPSLYSSDITNGNTNPYNIIYAVDISLNNGPFIQQPLAGLSTPTDIHIVGKCTTPYLQTWNFVLPKTTPASTYYQWKVRVRRVSTNILTVNTANEIYVDTISIVSNSQFSYPNSVVVGTSITADQFSSVPSRAYELDGLLMSVPSGYTPTQFSGDGSVLSAATYPNIWLGNFQTGVWTNNPAWVFYDILTSKNHGLGDYILPSSVDKWTLYQIGQYCDQLVDDGKGGMEPNFTCNISISQQQEAYNTLLSLASTFRGMLYYANGTIHASQTTTKTPVYEYTNANVLEGGFSYSDTAKNTRSTVVNVKWIDRNNGYRENVEYVEDTAGILRYGYIEKQMSAFACMSQGQAHRLGAWALLTEQLLTETVTFQTSLEGLYVCPGDVFAVYDNFRNNLSQGGRVIGFDAANNTVTLDRPVTLNPGLSYTLSVVVPKFTYDGTGDVTGSNQTGLIRNSQIDTLVVTTPAGVTGKLTTAGAFSSGFYVGTPWVLSSTGGNITSQASFYTCLATAEIEPGKIEILGLQANTGINFAISTGYTVVDLPINSGTVQFVNPPTNLLLTLGTGTFDNNLYFSTYVLSWNAPVQSYIAGYNLSGQSPGGVYSGYRTNDTSFGFPAYATGTYSFKVATVDRFGNTSAYLTTGATIGTGNPLGKLMLSGVTISEDFDPLYYDSGHQQYTGYLGLTPTFQWDIPIDVDVFVPQAQFVTGYRIRFQDYNGIIDYLPKPIYLSGLTNLSYKMAPGMIYTGMTGGLHRGFKVLIEPMDVFGNISSGAALNVNNPAPRQIVQSGFAPVGGVGTFSYDIQPAPESELSGIFFWFNTGTNLIPVPGNYNALSNLTAGTINTINMTGSNYFTWFALADNFGISGCKIYGPTPLTQLAITGAGGGVTLSSASSISQSVNYSAGAFSTILSLSKTSVGSVSVTADVTIYNNIFGGAADCEVRIYRGVTMLRSILLNSIPQYNSSTAHFSFTDVVAGGTNTYTVQVNGNSANGPSNSDEMGDSYLTLLG